MGLIKAAAASIGGSLADQWLECLIADDMNDKTVMTLGKQKAPQRRGLFTPGSSNTKGSRDTITNGSKIQIYPNQMMILMDGGRVVDYTAEEGYYEVYLSQSPSLLNGELKATIKDTFNRFKFGGTPSTNQQAVFINLQEIRGIKFGTRNPVQYFDNFYGAELFVRCHGMYSIRITDPIKFYMECVPRNADRVEIDLINEQYLTEFLTALQAAINQLSIDGIRVSFLPSKTVELSQYMAKVLDEDWAKNRGFEIVSVGVSSLTYDEESKNLINMRNQGAMMSDPNIREGFVQGSIAQGIKNAGSNTAGAAQAFMGMGMGMNAAGNFMGTASANNYAQMQAQQAQLQAQQAQAQLQAQQAQQAQPQPQGGANTTANANSWKCECGANNTGKFCAECGKSKPQQTAPNAWKCECGAENTGKFCAECGKPKPQPSTPNTWKCECGAENTGKFCPNCGKSM
jgi:membrane protease subunit (stomatin/prohibitin family)